MNGSHRATNRGYARLFGETDAGAAHLLRDVLQLRQSIRDSQPSLLVVDVDGRLVVLHHLRALCGVLLYVPTLSAPRVICTASGFHNVKALTGPADQRRQDSQWQ